MNGLEFVTLKCGRRKIESWDSAIKPLSFFDGGSIRYGCLREEEGEENLN